MKNFINIEKKNILIFKTNDNIHKLLQKKLTTMGANVIIADYESKNNYDNDSTSIYNINKKNNVTNEYILLKNLIQRKYKYIDSMILNNLIFPDSTPIEYFNTKKWINVINNNINNTFIIIKTFISLIKKSKNGSIIFNIHKNKKSNKAFIGCFESTNAYLISLMKTINDEYKNINNIRVNAININKIKNKILYPFKKKVYEQDSDIIDTYIYLINKNLKNKIISTFKNKYIF